MNSSLHGFFKGLNKLLCLMIRVWVVWCHTEVFDAILLSWIPQRWIAMGPLSNNNCSGNPYLKNRTWRIVFWEVVFNVFMTIFKWASSYYNQKWLRHEWCCKIKILFQGDVPDPKMQWCSCWMGLTWLLYRLTNRIAHICKWAAARESIPFLGPSVVVCGLWSVIRFWSAYCTGTDETFWWYAKNYEWEHPFFSSWA